MERGFPIHTQRIRPFLTTVLIVASATLIQWLLWPVIAPAPFILYYPAVILSVAYGSGPLSIVLSTIVLQYFFMEPRHSFHLDWPGDFVRLALYVGSAAMIDILGKSRARSLKNLNQEREKFRTLAAVVEATESFIGLATPDMKPFYINPAGLKMVGLANEQVPTTSLLDFFCPEDQERIRSEGVPALQRGERYTTETRFRNFQTGKPIPTVWNAFAVKDENGKPIAWATVSPDLSEMSSLRKAINRLQERLTLATEASGVGTWEWDIRTRVSTCSKLTLTLFGFDPEKPTRFHTEFIERVHPEDRPRVEECLRKAIEDTAVYDMEFRVLLPNQCVRWLAGKGQLVRDANGQPVAMQGVNFDITSRKQAELRLIESETRFKSAFSHAAVGMAVTSAAGRFLQVNPAYCAITGYSEAELLSMSFPDITHPEEREDNYRDTQALLTSPEPSKVFEKRYIKKTGETVWVQISLSILRDEQGHARNVIAIAEDITRRKLIAEELRQSEETFRTMANAIPQLSWMAAANGDIVWYNQRWYDFTGTTLQQMDGVGWAAVLHPDHREPVLRSFRQHIASGTPWEETFPLRARSGEWRWFLARAEPIRDLHGRVIRWLGTATDITEKREVQEQLQATVRARDEFVSIASHELKTPITALKLQSEMAQRGIHVGDPRVYSPERVNRFVSQTNRQADRLLRLVDDMLDASRIRTGKLSILPGEMELCSLARETIEKLRPAMTEAGTPPSFVCEDRIEGRWDHMRMEQVVTNLLTNAMRYGERKPVQIRLERRGDTARLVVQDQGIGISREAQERIFDRYERIGASKATEGLGLGLFITRQIVIAHGGRIWVESDGPGRGTTFIVELPISGTKETSPARTA